MAVISGKQMYKKGEQIRKNVWEHGNIGQPATLEGNRGTRTPPLPPTGRPSIE